MRKITLLSFLFFAVPVIAQWGSGSTSVTNNYSWTGSHTFSTFVTAPTMLEFLGGALQATPTTGAADTTSYYMPVKAFSVGDSATFDFTTSKRFASIDSILVMGWSNTATSNVVLNVQIRQTVLNGLYVGAFNTVVSTTLATGTASTQRAWAFTSLGSVTAARSTIRGKIYRTAGGTGGDVFVERVLIYGVGLR